MNRSSLMSRRVAQPALVSPRAHVNKMAKPVQNPNLRRIGLGNWNERWDSSAKQQRFIGFIQSMQQAPTYNVPMIDSVTWHFDGPLTNEQAAQTFGATINPLGSNTDSPPPGCVQVDTTFAEPGKWQTFVLVCAFQWRYDIEPLEFTTKVNAFTRPDSARAKPVSADMYNVADLDPVTGTLGLTGTETMVPGNLEWGWWQGAGFYYQSRGYNLQWQYGHNFNLVNDKLQYTAYLPSNAQDGSASSSQVDVEFFARRTNDYYRNFLDPDLIALTIDRARLGNMTLGRGEAPPTGLSVYRPTRAYDLVGATYGGAGVRNMVGKNQEFRRMASPFLAWPGVPIGLKAQVSAEDDAALQRAYFDATYGFGGTSPGVFTEDENILVGDGTTDIVPGVTGQEPSLDSPSLPQFQQLQAQRAVFKGGAWKLTVAFKGFELTPDQAQMVKSIDFQNVLQSECGCQLSPQGTASS